MSGPKWTLLLAGLLAGCGGEALGPVADGEGSPPVGVPWGAVPVAFACPVAEATATQEQACPGFRDCPDLLLSNVGQRPALASDGESIFAPSWSAGFWRAPRDGSTQPEQLMSNRPGTSTLVADEDYVFATAQDGRLWRYRFADDTSRPLVLGTYPSELALSDEHVYWGYGSSLVRIPKEGAESVEVFAVNPLPSTADTPVNMPVVHGDYVYWLALYERPRLDYSTDPPVDKGGKTAIVRAPIAGGKTQTFITAECNISHFALHGDDLYFAHAESGTIARRSVTATKIENVVTGAGAVTRVVVQDDGIYWAETTTGYGSGLAGAVFGVAHGGSAPVLLAADLYYASWLAVDDEAIYFTDNAYGTLYRTAKPW